jgi:hypothetical protein
MIRQDGKNPGDTVSLDIGLAVVMDTFPALHLTSADDTTFFVFTGPMKGKVWSGKMRNASPIELHAQLSGKEEPISNPVPARFFWFLVGGFFGSVAQIWISTW